MSHFDFSVSIDFEALSFCGGISSRSSPFAKQSVKMGKAQVRPIPYPLQCTPVGTEWVTPGLPRFFKIPFHSNICYGLRETIEKSVIAGLTTI